MTPYQLAPYDKLIVYQKNYTSDFVRKAILDDNLDGLRIFAHLKDQKLENLDFLKEYTFLERLDISTVIENDFDYSFLKNLQNLKHLSLGICVLNKKSSNTVNVGSLVKLKTFSVEFNQQFCGLENCLNIERLFLGDFKQSDLNTISCLPNLKTLRIKESTISELSGIESFKNLESALFGHCKRLKDVKAINGLQNLSKLTFSNCPKIKTVNTLNQLPRLEMLELIDCKEIDTFNFINHLPNLQNLKFGGTIILDGNLTPAQRIKSVFYHHKKQYNIKLDTTEQDEIYKKNMQKLKEWSNGK
jgi:hypothetical protein